MSNKLTITLGVLAALAVVPAFAQSPLEVQIPFEFKVGEARMAAGAYRVSFHSPVSVLVRNLEDNRAAVVLTNGRSNGPNSANDQSKLVFTRYGDRYFLWQIWAPGSQGRELPKTKVEAELARRMTINDLVALSPKR